MTLEEKAAEIVRRLSLANPDPKIELNFTTPIELLAATILSAQATDKSVNLVTPALFARFKTVADYAASSPEEIDAYVQKINFHNTKAKNIYLCANAISERFGGKLPDTMQDLLTLPGVARKTANVILGTAFGKAEGIVVDTHCIRLSQKLGLTTHTDAVKIEQDLMRLIPRDKWIAFGHLLTLHGRYMCTARPHTCDGCPLGDLCPEYAGITA